MEVGEYAITKNRTIISKIISIDEKAIILNKIGINIKVSPSNILAHSFNLIDILEPGDYINGKRIYKIETDENTKFAYVESKDFEYKGRFTEDEINTILTKQQYERECYRKKD